MTQIFENPFESPTARGRLADPQPHERTWKKRILLYGMVIAFLILIIALLLPARRRVPEAARRMTCQNNLRQIALAMQAYESTHGELPPAFTVDESGKPLHSWRVLLLPFLEQNALYASIDLTRPWDDPVNEHARSIIISPYQCPTSYPPRGYTTYLANSWEGGVFPPGKEGRKLSEISNATKSTILLFETGRQSAVEWMSPIDGDFDALKKHFDSDRGPHPGGVNVATVDGKSHLISKSIDAESLRSCFSIAGGETDEIESFK